MIKPKYDLIRFSPTLRESWEYIKETKVIVSELDLTSDKIYGTFGDDGTTFTIKVEKNLEPSRKWAVVAHESVHVEHARNFTQLYTLLTSDRKGFLNVMKQEEVLAFSKEIKVINELAQQNLVSDKDLRRYGNFTAEQFIDAAHSMFGGKTYEDLWNEGYDKFETLLDKDGLFRYHRLVFDIWESKHPETYELIKHKIKRSEGQLLAV